MHTVTPMNQYSPIPSPDDEINLLELIHEFLLRWRWWLGGALAGGVLGTAGAFVIPPKFEANGVVQVAQVTSPVETVPETIVRMQTLAFREEVANRLVQRGQLAPTQKETWVKALAAKSVLKPLKDAGNYLSISIQAGSPALGHAVITTVLEVLKERQQPLMQERLAQVSRRIDLARKNLAALEAQQGSVQNSLKPQSSKDGAYLELARMSEAGTLADLRQKLLDLENSRLSPTTRSTKLVEPVGVSERPVSPKKQLLVLAGLVLGGAIGTLLGFGLPAWRSFLHERKEMAATAD